jgi:hypothetical protein
MGRISAIYCGIRKDRHGGALADPYCTMDDRILSRAERAMRIFNFLRPGKKRDRYRDMNRCLVAYAYNGSRVVCGHTHRAGRVGDWHLNTGTWVEPDKSCTFVRVTERGWGLEQWHAGCVTPATVPDLPY